MEILLSSGNIEKEKKLKKFLSDEIEEIQKYKWFLGIKLCHDPLNDITMNEISSNWIKLYAKEFRKNWENMHGKVSI